MITVERISRHRQEDGNHEYLVDGHVFGFARRVHAPSPEAAKEALLCRRISLLEEELERRTPIAPLPIVGQALRSGGILEVERTENGFLPYIEAARLLGYEAETHTVEAVTFLARAAEVEGWAPTMRGTLSLFTIDTRRGNRIEAFRWLSLSRDWWKIFAAGILTSAAPLAPAEHRRALDRDTALYPSTAAMFAGATIIEIGGAV